MDRRFVLAIVLMMAVLIIPSLFMERPAAPPRQAPAPGQAAEAPPVQAAVPPPAPAEPGALAGLPADSAGGLPAPDSVVVTSPLYRYVFSTRGGRMLSASLLEYKSMRPDERGRPAQILHPDPDLLAMALLRGRDTVRLGDWHFDPSADELSVTDGPATLTLTAATGAGLAARIEYRFRPDDYRIEASGTIEGVGPAGATLLVGLGPGLRNTESDSAEHAREVGLVTKDTRSELIPFGKLDRGEPATLTGPFEWVAVKSKYFTTALLALDTTRAGHGGIGGAFVVTDDRQHKTPERADVWTSLSVAATGAFGFSMYIGPMEYGRLQAVGHDFDDINPYGWAWLRPIIRPVAIAARWLLVWFHERLGLAYGLGLMLFGVLIRVVLWPLNQKAMRAGMQMQAIQPVLKEIQEKYKNEPQRLQQEMFKVYKEYKVNPFSGCWPLLLPWPILIALFFVFQNSIELRGASFLWIPDLSRPDPLYIIPVLMGVSMFAVTKVGQMGLPPNPQAKMLLYVMPVMMIVLFFGLASGLNLYYATVNIASIPQQWLVARGPWRGPAEVGVAASGPGGVAAR
jgi:YidC/Oxa1 family membrane protein insertase